MIYEEQLGFDWSAFGKVATSLGDAGKTVYESYTNLQIAREMARTNTEQKRIDLEIAQLQAQAIAMQLQSQGGQSTLSKNILPLAIAGGAGLLALTVLK